MLSHVPAAQSGIVTAVLVGLGVACGAQRPSDEPQPGRSSGAEQALSGSARPSSPQAPAPDLGYHMRTSFWDAVQARDALLAGELSRAQSAADRLAKFDDEHALPQDWQHWVTQLRGAAKELSIAPNLDAAAAELGRLALVCGDCHDLHHEGPARPRTQPLPWQDPPETFDARMHRHQLGVAQLWDGLVLPSEDAWRNGTVTITRAPLTAPEIAAGEEPIDDATHVRIEAIRALAKRARTASTYEARGQVFGEIVARCADCHAFARPNTEFPHGT